MTTLTKSEVGMGNPEAAAWFRLGQKVREFGEMGQGLENFDQGESRWIKANPSNSELMHRGGWRFAGGSWEKGQEVRELGDDAFERMRFSGDSFVSAQGGSRLVEVDQGP